MFNREDYINMAEKANAENKALFIVGTGTPDVQGNFEGELVMADYGYYLCREGTNITDGALNPAYEELKKSEALRKLRAKREEVCFSVVNRGKAWYDSLTIEQYEQLKAWYQAWLCVTKTFVEPVTPAWIK